MKGARILLQGMLIVLALVVGGGIVLSMQSRTPPALGPLNGRLRPCPDTPNCVCSQAPASDVRHAIAPLGHARWQALRHAIEALGGHIDRDNGHYLHATFTSRVFRFVDDVEVLRDAQGVLQIRSASRVGRSDLGVNRKRVEAIRSGLK